MKICLLVCDVMTGKMKTLFKSHKDLFIKLFDNCDNNIDLHVYNCRENLPQIDKYDGFIINGSKSSAYSNYKWIHNLIDLIKEIDKRKLKLLGICFGHQVIAKALGANVIKSPLGWEVGISKIRLNKVGKKYFNSNKSFIKIYQIHQDIVCDIPKKSGLQCIASNKFSENQVLIKDDYILTLQGHPEYSSYIIKYFINDLKLDYDIEKLKLDQKINIDIFMKLLCNFFS